MRETWGGTVSSLDFSERWMRDGTRAIDATGGICSLLIDMSACRATMRQLKDTGVDITYGPVIVSAVAKALARHPKLQIMNAGNKKLAGGRIDICLSIAGAETITPVVIIEDADRKAVQEIGSELAAKIPGARGEADRMLKLLRRWGWIVPLGFVRRRCVGMLLNQIWYRRKVSGMFQVTILPGLDLFAAQTFNTAGALAVGGIAQRPMVVDDEVKPRLTAPFTCTYDHKQWNGMSAKIFLTELQQILEHEVEALFVKTLSSKPLSD